MTTAEDGISGRITKLVEKLGSQADLARMVGVTPAAIHFWIAGSRPYEKNLRTIAERTGVSLEWLRDGKGDEKAEISALARRLKDGAIMDETADPHSPASRLREVPPMYSCPPASEHQYTLEAAEMLDTQEISALIGRVLKDKTPSARRLAQGLSEMLSRKLSREGERHTQKQ